MSAADSVKAAAPTTETSAAAAPAAASTPIFSRPLLHSCDSYSVIAIDMTALRSRGTALTWDGFIAELLAELDAVQAGRPINPDTISYSTATQPTKYANPFTAKTLQLLQDRDAARAEAEAALIAHNRIEAERPPEEPYVPQYDEDGEEIPPKPKKKSQMRAEQEQRNADLQRVQALLDAQHKAQRLEQRTRIMEKAFALRLDHLTPGPHIID